MGIYLVTCTVWGLRLTVLFHTPVGRLVYNSVTFVKAGEVFVRRILVTVLQFITHDSWSFLNIGC